MSKNEQTLITNDMKSLRLSVSIRPDTRTYPKKQRRLTDTPDQMQEMAFAPAKQLV